MSNARVPSPSPIRRAGAPIIKIDTSAVGNVAASNQHIALHSMSNSSPSIQGEHRSGTPFLSSSSPTVTSPGNFLSVPGRTRGDSFDSNSGQSSSSLGSETWASTASPLSDGSHAKLGGGDSTTELLTTDDPLQPDPGTEDDFKVVDNKFAFSPGQLSKLLNPKNYAAFHALGGLAGLEKGLRTNLKSGLSADEEYLDGQITFDEATRATTKALPQGSPERQLSRQDSALITAASKKETSFADRKRIFKDNRLPERKTKNIFQLMWMAYNDKVLILLSVAAVISLALGIYQSVGTPHADGEAPVEWVEGVAIMVAIIIVVVVGAINDWQKEQQFVKLNKKKEDRHIKVIRSGKVQELSIYDILVGDLVVMDPGDMIPVDGIFIEGHNVKCDESSATGESDVLKKSSGAEVFKLLENNESVGKMDPFILSGGKVTEGIGRFVVTAVGINSTFGKTMMSLRDEGEVTPLQSKLNVLAENIAKLGGAAALLYFIVAFIEFLVNITRGPDASLTAAKKGQSFLLIFILAVSIIVVAVPEGLPLAVTLALAFATTRMLKDNNLVRLLRSCETMGNATTVCSDKTGTLTQNKMTVVAGTLGTDSRFGDREGVETTGQSDGTPADKNSQSTQAEQHSAVAQQEFVSTLSSDVKHLLEQSIAINSTAFEGEEDGKMAFIGSKTETALLEFARQHLGMGPVSVERSNAEIVQLVPFNSGRKCMAAVVKLSRDKYRVYVKGASEILLAQCTKIIEDPTHDVSERDMSTDQVEMLQAIISVYANRSLRTIALCYKDYDSWPPRGARKQEDDPNEVTFDELLKNLNFLGVVGIQDPLRPGVIQAVKDFKTAGVVVRMVTGDNVQTAKAIASECGIYTPGGVIMEGPEFRKLGRAEMDKVIPNLQVLARSSPEDKRILVKRLKALGETVASTGDGTNDAPALKAADVGFSMGIAGTEVAKEASAIILMDDNFSSIVKALLWGRAVNDAVKKFLQFQVTVNITAVLVTFVSGVSSANNTPVLTAVQLLWVNLIMDTFAALALATDPPSPSMLDRKPDRKDAPLITLTMWKMIIGQAIYQLVIIFVLYFKGQDIFGYESALEMKQLQTLTFNAFVWMQIFNAFNNRRLDNRLNIFEGISRNWFFVGIIALMVGGQTLIVFVGGQALSATPLNGPQWAYSLILGFLTIPLGIVIRQMPDAWIGACIPAWLRRKAQPKVVIEDEEARYEWNRAITEIRQELAFIKRFKGGRLNNLKFKLQNPREMLPSRPSSSRARSRSSTVNSTMSHTPGGEHGEPTVVGPSTLIAPPTPEADKKSSSSAKSRRRRAVSTSGLMPAMAAAGIVAGSIGGWSPIERRPSDAEPFTDAPSKGHAKSKSDPKPGMGKSSAR